MTEKHYKTLLSPCGRVYTPEMQKFLEGIKETKVNPPKKDKAAGKVNIKASRKKKRDENRNN